jgi:hypothetical protein
MKTRIRLIKYITISLLMTSMWTGCATMKPTATVIDDETGKPIEGAVALCIWRESVEGYAWFEGGMERPSKIIEILSDKDGNIYIPDYWDWHLFEEDYPRLTIYKFGYVCWDQYTVYINENRTELRKDFNRRHRTVRMKKWPEGFSFIRHRSFINTCTRDDYQKTMEKIFFKEIDLEIPYERKESMKIK